MAKSWNHSVKHTHYQSSFVMDQCFGKKRTQFPTSLKQTVQSHFSHAMDPCSTLAGEQAPCFRHPLCHWQSGSNKETKQALTYSLVTNKLPGHTPDGLPPTGTSRKKTAGFPFLPDAQLKGWCELILFANIWQFKPSLMDMTCYCTGGKATSAGNNEWDRAWPHVKYYCQRLGAECLFSFPPSQWSDTDLQLGFGFFKIFVCVCVVSWGLFGFLTWALPAWHGFRWRYLRYFSYQRPFYVKLYKCVCTYIYITDAKEVKKY